ncbi:MAG: SCO family protein [Paracoccaceae bacterium]
MTRHYATAASATVIALIGVSAWFAFGNRPDDPLAECRASVVASGAADIGGPFTLIDETGATVTDTDVITGPTLVYFGYTFCPDVCPLDNARNAEAVDILQEMGLSVKPVFISVDPARDTPEQLAAFTDAMHPDMLGLTGSEEQVKAASAAYKTYFKVQDPGDEYTLIDHSTFTYLMFPKTGFAEFFKRDDTADDVARRTACFIEALS